MGNTHPDHLNNKCSGFKGREVEYEQIVDYAVRALYNCTAPRVG